MSKRGTLNVNMHRVEFESRRERGGMNETFEIICGLHVFMMHKLFVPCLS